MSTPCPGLPRPRWRRRTLRLVAGTWVATGLLAPLLVGVLQPELLIGPGLLLSLVLIAFAVAGSNVELRFSLDDSGPVWSPVGVPIVLAVVACSVPQAMLVTALGYLLDRATWGRGRLLAIETAGLGAMSAGGAALLAHSIGLRFDSPGIALVSAIAASVLFLVLDAVTYAVWYQFESGTGGYVLRCFVGAAPIDVTFTTVAVLVTGPFIGAPFVVALVLAGCQGAIYALYRLVTSESRHRQQSDHLREVFSRYVPEQVAQRLATSPDKVRLGGELRDVTVLFCDIRGFTGWAERRDAESVVGELNSLLGGLAEIVMESFGTLDKFTGDGLMAFWGAPLDQPDHAERACRAAIGMQQLLDRRHRELLIGDDFEFRIGVGIASGPVVVGNVGHEKRLDYTAIGDTVNLAARLEQSTKELGVPTVVSHDTWLRLPPAFRERCANPTTVTVKGRVAPVQVHALVHDVTVMEAGTNAQPGSSASGFPLAA